MKMHLLSFPNGFEKTEVRGQKLKNIAPNIQITETNIVYTP